MGCPFQASQALDQTQLSTTHQPGSIQHVPDAFTVSLSQETVTHFLLAELDTPILHELYPHLWMVGRKRYDHIDPLHSHILKGRRVVLSENVNLHLIWTPQSIYLKPIPRALLNYQIWSEYLDEPELIQDSKKPTEASASPSDLSAKLKRIRSLACGFLRSYDVLVRHPSDLRLAQQHLLIPDKVSWAQWQEFISPFSLLDDCAVSPRYHYGQLRLSRLNWTVRIFQPLSKDSSYFYHIPYWSIATYLRHILAPLIFLFASVSVLLSALQVMLGSAGDNDQAKVNILNSDVARLTVWAVALTLAAFTVLIWLLIFMIPTIVLIGQLSWGFKNRNQ